MAEDRTVTITISAKNLTAEAFKRVQQDLKGAGEEAARQKVSLQQMATAVGAAAGVVAGLAAGVAKLGEHGATVNDVREHFGQLTATMGASADVMGRLREATLGNISNFELMKTVNLGLSQGLQLSADQLTQVGDVAAVLADRIGGDVSQSFETLIQAMATGQDKTLKTIGLNIDAAKATADYAVSIGKAANELTEQEKKEAIKNAILAEGQRVLSVSGKAQADFGDKVAQSKTALSNFIDSVSSWVATSPSIGAWSSTITAAASAVTAMGLAFGPVSAGLSRLLPLIGLAGIGGAFAGLLPILAAVAVAAAAVWAAFEIGERSGLTDWLGKKLAGALYGVSAAEYDASRSAAKLAEAHGKVGATSANLTAQIKQAQEAMARELATQQASAAATAARAEALKKAKKVDEDAIEAFQNIRMALIPLTVEQQRQVVEWQRSGLAVGDMAKALRVSTDAVNHYLEGLKALSQEIPTVNAGLADFTQLISSQLIKSGNDEIIRTAAAIGALKEPIDNGFDGLTKFGIAVDEIPPKLSKVQQVSIQVFDAVTRSIADNLAAAIVHVQSFGDAFTNIWQSLKFSVLNILAEILEKFVKQFLGGILNSILGSQGAFSGAFSQTLGGSFQGVLGGMSKQLSGWLASAGSALASLIGIGGGAAGGAAAASAAISGTAAASLAAGGAGVAAGAAAGGGGAAAAMTGLLTNPITAIVAGGIAAGVGIKKWMEQREHMAVNKLRDAWFAQHGGLAGVNQAAEAATGNLALTQAIFAAKQKDDFARAVNAWKNATGLALGTGGRFFDFGLGTPVILHGRERVMTEAEGQAEGRGDASAFSEALVAANAGVMRDLGRELSAMRRDIRDMGPSFYRAARDLVLLNISGG